MQRLNPARLQAASRLRKKKKSHLRKPEKSRQLKAAKREKRKDAQFSPAGLKSRLVMSWLFANARCGFCLFGNTSMLKSNTCATHPWLQNPTIWQISSGIHASIGLLLLQSQHKPVQTAETATLNTYLIDTRFKFPSGY
ncbi:hypothetical protein [Saccharophagus sp. K07]|uniref:hypothetical protein n=1 Tax=Saccharophagus sp. K07 TaxID=2283636 RepID=UPI00210646BC|nr:hypothetical protein [Saccharophagus sp. K07]